MDAPLACGDPLATVVLMIGHRVADNGHSVTDAAEVGPWCFSCVSMANEAMKAVQGSTSHLRVTLD